MHFKKYLFLLWVTILSLWVYFEIAGFCSGYQLPGIDYEKGRILALTRPREIRYSCRSWRIRQKWSSWDYCTKLSRVSTTSISRIWTESKLIIYNSTLYTVIMKLENIINVRFVRKIIFGVITLIDALNNKNIDILKSVVRIDAMLFHA